MWRKPDEANKPDLAGEKFMRKQIPLERALPMWGGLAAGGFRVVTFHKTKKISTEEWVATLNSGKLRSALGAVNPQRRRGPWTVLCDGEGFLRASAAKDVYRAQAISLLQIPARSPDLNPVEKFWAWLRKQLVASDLADLKARRATPGKTVYRERVRRLCHSQRAQTVAGNIARSWHKTCKAVVKAKGAGVRG